MREKDVDLKAALVAAEQIIPAFRKGKLDPQIVETLTANPAMWNYIFFHMRTGDVTLNDMTKLVRSRTNFGAYLMNEIQLHARVLMGENFVNLYSFAQAMRGFLRFDKSQEESAATIPFSKEVLLWAKSRNGILFPGHPDLHLNKIREVFGSDMHKGAPCFMVDLEAWYEVATFHKRAALDRPWYLVVPVPDRGFDESAPKFDTACVTQMVVSRVLSVRADIRPKGEYGWPSLSFMAATSLGGADFHLYCHGDCVELGRPVHHTKMRMVSVVPGKTNVLDDQVCCPMCSQPDIHITYSDPLRVKCRSCAKITVVGRGPVCEGGREMSWSEQLARWVCTNCVH